MDFPIHSWRHCNRVDLLFRIAKASALEIGDRSRSAARRAGQQAKNSADFSFRRWTGRWCLVLKSVIDSDCIFDEVLRSDGDADSLIMMSSSTVLVEGNIANMLETLMKTETDGRGGNEWRYLRQTRIKFYGRDLRNELLLQNDLIDGV